MTHVACVAFAPVRTLQRMNSPEWQQPGRTTYWPGSIRRLPNREVPLLVDHDFQIGTVTDIVEMDWPDGRWFCGLAEVTDARCLRSGMGASFSFIPTAAYNDELGDRVLQAFLKEITVCVATQPVEPSARLVTIHRSPAHQHTFDGNANGEVITTTGLIRRPSGVILGVR